jgi:hypothetical protein
MASLVTTTLLLTKEEKEVITEFIASRGMKFSPMARIAIREYMEKIKSGQKSD